MIRTLGITLKKIQQISKAQNHIFNQEDVYLKKKNSFELDNINAARIYYYAMIHLH